MYLEYLHYNKYMASHTWFICIDNDFLGHQKNCWYVASYYHSCHVNRQAMGDKTSAGSVLDCPIQVGGECSVFFQSAGPIYSQLNNCVSCYAGFDGWWYSFEFEVWILAVYDPVSLAIPWLACSIHLGRSIASTPGPCVGVTLGSAAQYAYPALDASLVC